MTKATERNIFQVGGTLAGWILAQLYDKKDTVPFTVVGGLLGFIISQEFIPDNRSALKGLPRKRRQAKK